MMQMLEYYQHLAELGRRFNVQNLLTLKEGEALFRRIMDEAERDLGPGGDPKTVFFQTWPGIQAVTHPPA